MTLSLEPARFPLQMDAEGAVRVGQTRVTLDTVVGSFTNGATPEQIADQYPSLALADIYAVIAYYLGHREEVESYLARRQQKRDEVQRSCEAQFDPRGVRDRLMARRKGRAT